MHELAHRRRNLPAPPRVVWRSLAEPHDPAARPWLDLRDDEVAPRVLRGEEPHALVWSSIWPARPDDEIDFALAAGSTGTDLTFTLRSPDDVQDPAVLGHLRKRLNVMLWADLRYSYGA
ncbi:hypothetical protein GCM10023340_22190 [Nocardioides marinquilinus]|uniref:Uncharacterized protein n=1 Tax=Nocardioides marinquilinus TaxID=1210400 RepID=A0ABP9PL56_9ACTN